MENWKTLFLGVSGRVFLGGLAFESIGWGKEMALRNVVGVIQTLRAPVEQKGRGWANFLSAGAETSISSCPGHQSSRFSGRRPQAGSYTVASLVSRPSDLDWVTLLAFPVLQLADGGYWDFLPSKTTWDNSHNKAPLISLYIILVCFPGEPWLIHSDCWQNSFLSGCMTGGPLASNLLSGRGCPQVLEATACGILTCGSSFLQGRQDGLSPVHDQVL